jgi:glycosyltransferase involved in cell wall biosynthesis
MDYLRTEISIGMPVFNGERFLSEAINSILRQSFRDFELIICDNASTDSTEEICREFQKVDNRVHYYRSATNCGAAWNFNRTFQLSRGKYFKWAAHDDVCAPEYLSVCYKAMEEDDSIVLCQADAHIIDERGKILDQHPHRSERINEFLRNTGDTLVHKRFADLVGFMHPCFDVFGVIRATILKKTKLIRSFIGSDRVLLAELGLYGRFHRVPQHLFLSRSHSGRSIAIHDRRALNKWFNAGSSTRFVLPRWRLLWEYFDIVFQSSLGPAEKRRCYAILLMLLAASRSGLVTDLEIAVRDAAPSWVRIVYNRLKEVGSR